MRYFASCRLSMRLTAHLRQYKFIYLGLLLAAAAGFAFGLSAPMAMDDASAAACRSYIGNYLTLLPTSDFDRMSEFMRALRSAGLLLSVVLLSGLHLLGALPAVAAVFYKTFTLGCATGFLLVYQGGSGVLLILLAIAPQNLLLLVLLLWSANNAIRCSIMLWQNRMRELTRYALTALPLAAGLVLVALLQSYLTPLLLSLFHIIS